MCYHIFWISILNRSSDIALLTDMLSYFLDKYIEQMRCYCMGYWCAIIFSGLVYWTDEVLLHGVLMCYHIFWISILNRWSVIAWGTDVLSYFLDYYIEQMRCYCMGYWCDIIFSGLVYGTDEVLLHGKLMWYSFWNGILNRGMGIAWGKNSSCLLQFSTY